jgi:mono/diheme cytochrome c family protein
VKKFGKILGWTLVIVILLAATGISFTIGWRPFIGPRSRQLDSSRKFESTSARLARGKYLAENVNGCMFCHTPRDWTSLGSGVIQPNLGSGEAIPIKGLPGKLVAPNLTPDPETGAGTWSDDQLARAIREGVGHDGRALFPFMPYERYRSMSDEDLASIIVYVRALPPVRNPLPQSEIVFPVKYLIRNVPAPLTTPVPAPELSTPEKRGAYLTTMGGCSDCHTPQDGHGTPLPGMEWAGGMIIEGPFGRVASANLTPDSSGIPYYDTKMFVDAIRAGSVRARKLNPIMPTEVYRGMTDEDLTSIFAYLKTLKPVRHHVDNTEPSAFCKICKAMHGGSNTN